MTTRLWWIPAALLALGACDDPGDLVDGGRNDGGSQTMDGGGSADVCEGVTNPCTTEGTHCDGTTVVRCEANDDGCLVESTKSCTAIRQVCDDSGAEAQCVAPVDPCEGVPVADRCETEDARACNGGTLEVCTMNAAGCLVLERTECDAADGGFCDESGTMPACVAPADPCASIPADERCTAEGTSCDGDNLVTCAPDAFGCLVETATDCSAATDGTCDGTPAMCTFTGDACEGVTQCDAEGVFCDGPELVECAPDAFGCLVETRTTCTDVMFGFCDADAATPMCSTAGLDPCMGETECGTETTRVCNGDDTAVESCAPNAFGCFVAETTPCAISERCSEDRGTAVCGPFDPNCPAAEPMVLDCASGTVSGDTAMGAANIDSYVCQSILSYPDKEQIWRFEDAERAVVTISATRGSGEGDYDLYVLEGVSGAMCTSGLTCLAFSVESEPVETVEFIAEPGATHYVVYDRFDDVGTTPYTLEVSCAPIVCGDGVLTGDEGCDDGNALGGDGCSDTCQVESGYACETPGSPCVVVCGNGVIDPGEACDDGNALGGDGCSERCQVEPDSYCSGQPSVCEPMVCGDGVVVGDERCDDGNAVAGDGCSERCQIEAGYVCDGAGPGSCTEVGHRVCSGARPVTGTVTFVDEPLSAGGPMPPGPGCGPGDGSTALYYEVTIPPRTRVIADAQDGPDTVMMVQSTCLDTGCTVSVDEPEVVALLNTGATPITRVVSVRPWDAASAPFTIHFTYTSLAPNAACADATPLTSSLAGEDLAAGGIRPIGSQCGSSPGPVRYYSVDVPAESTVSVTGTAIGGWDLTLRTLEDCSGGCLGHVDESTGDPETLELSNLTDTAMTRLIAVGADSSTAYGTFDLDVTTEAITYAANATCAGATPLVAGTAITGEDTATGGASPTGATCQSSGAQTLYYEATVPAGQVGVVEVTTESGFDIIVMALDSCGAPDCSARVDDYYSGTERLTIDNVGGASELVQVVAVNAEAAGATGVFDIALTLAAPAP